MTHYNVSRSSGFASGFVKWSAAVALLLGFLLGSIVAGGLTGVVEPGC